MHFVSQHSPRRTVANVVLTPYVLYAVIGRKVDGGLALRAAFGGYYHHAVGSARPIDGCCRGVFKHLHALDVGSVEEVDVAHHHSVYNEKWVRIVQRANSAHANRYSRTRRTRKAGYVYTCHLPLQGVGQCRCRQLAHFFHVYHRYGACYVFLLLRSVAHHNHFANGVSRFAHRNGDVLFACHVNALWGISHVRKQQHVVCSGQSQREIAVGIGGGSGSAALCQHRNALQGLIGGGIDNRTHNCSFARLLRLQAQGREQQCKQHREIKPFSSHNGHVVKLCFPVVWGMKFDYRLVLKVHYG